MELRLPNFCQKILQRKLNLTNQQNTMTSNGKKIITNETKLVEVFNDHFI